MGNQLHISLDSRPGMFEWADMQSSVWRASAGCSLPVRSSDLAPGTQHSCSRTPLTLPNYTPTGTRKLPFLLKKASAACRQPLFLHKQAVAHEGRDKESSSLPTHATASPLHHHCWHPQLCHLHHCRTECHLARVCWAGTCTHIWLY